MLTLNRPEIDFVRSAKDIGNILKERGKRDSFSVRRMRLLAPFFGKHLALGVATLFLTVVVSALTLPTPLIQRQIIDKYVPAMQVKVICALGAVLFGLYLSSFVAKLLLSYTSSKLNNVVLLDIKQAVFERMMTLPMSFFSENQSSYLASRMNEIDRAGTLFSITFTSLLVSVLTFLSAGVLLLILDWRIFAVAAVFAPVQYIIIHRFTSGIRNVSNAVLEKSANVNRGMQEVFAGMSTVKAFSAERREATKMAAPLSSLFKSSFLQAFALRSTTDIIGFLREIAFLAVLVGSMLFIIRGNLTLGTYVAAVGLVERMFGPVQAVASAGLTIQPVIVALSRVADYFEVLSEDAAQDRRHCPARLKGKIEFRHVAFSYPGKDFLLRDVSFTIHPGERVVIVGPNGSGKTTLMKLLLQLHLPSQGSILVDDRDAATFTLESLRRKIGLVSQDVFLFNDTILRNLMYGGVSPEASELRWLVDRCCSSLKELPDGLNTRVGEGGANLSGGQRQSISIVRALLKDPDILIIDEGSTHLDAATRESLRSIVEEQCSDKTCILISHDPAVAGAAHRVLVVDGGTVSEKEVRLRV
jgi:ATP-binding cassette subfamily B protein